MFTDLARSYVLNLENCALTYLADRRSDRADVTVTLDRNALSRLVLRELSVPEAIQSDRIHIDGDPGALGDFFGLLDTFASMFEVVEPRREASRDRSAR